MLPTSGYGISCIVTWGNVNSPITLKISLISDMDKVINIQSPIGLRVDVNSPIVMGFIDPIESLIYLEIDLHSLIIDE